MKDPLPQLSNVLERLLRVLLFAMFAMVALLVVLRYVFGTTIIGGNEATVVAFIFTTAIGASIAIGRGEHIAIDYFVGKLPVRVQQNISQVRLALLLLVNAVIFFFAVIWIQRTGGFLMPTLGLPQLVAQISIPIGSGLSMVYCVMRLLNR